MNQANNLLFFFFFQIQTNMSNFTLKKKKKIKQTKPIDLFGLSIFFVFFFVALLIFSNDLNFPQKKWMF